MNDAPVVIASFQNAHEAHLARGRLEAEGILVSIVGEHLTDLTTTLAGSGGPVKLKVPAGQAERAREILAQDFSEEIDREACEGPPDRDSTICPACGSASVIDLRSHHKPGLWSLLFGTPGMLIGNRFKCLTCGQRWR